MAKFLTVVQRVLEAAPMRGKGRLANLLLKGQATEVACHPLPGLTIHLDPQQRVERLMWAGAYERSLVKTLKLFLKPGMVFLDLGANIGYFSALAAALVGPSGRMFAFEPSPFCSARLQLNLRGFEQAIISNYAVSNQNGRSSFYVHATEKGWGSLFTDGDLTTPIEVDTIRLDDWSHKAAIERLDFIKIDIEGGEYDALLGARSLLERFRPVIVAELNSVCLSRNHRTPDDVIGLLCELGYSCKRMQESVFAATKGR